MSQSRPTATVSAVGRIDGSPSIVAPEPALLLTGSTGFGGLGGRSWNRNGVCMAAAVAVPVGAVINTIPSILSRAVAVAVEARTIPAWATELRSSDPVVASISSTRHEAREP